MWRQLPSQDYRRSCEKLTERFGQNLIERTERSLAEDYKVALERDPKLVFERMVLVYRQYVVPFEVLFGIDSLMKEKFRVEKWEIASAANRRFSLRENETELRQYISSFYKMVEEAGVRLGYSEHDQRSE